MASGFLTFPRRLLLVRADGMEASRVKQEAAQASRIEPGSVTRAQEDRSSSRMQTSIAQAATPTHTHKGWTEAAARQLIIRLPTLGFFASIHIPHLRSLCGQYSTVP